MGVQILTPGIKPASWPVRRAIVRPPWREYRARLLWEVALWEGAGDPRDTVSGNGPSSTNGTPSWTIGPRGRSLLCTPHDTESHLWSGVPTAAGGLTVVVFGRSRNASANANNHGIIGKWGGTANEWIIWTQVGGTQDWQWQVATSTGNVTAATTAYRDTDRHLFVGTYQDGGEPRLYVDGKLEATGSTGGDHNLSDANLALNGYNSSATTAMDCEIDYAAVLNWEMPAPVVSALYADVFAPIRPAERRVFNAAAPAADNLPLLQAIGEA